MASLNIIFILLPVLVLQLIPGIQASGSLRLQLSRAVEQGGAERTVRV